MKIFVCTAFKMDKKTAPMNRRHWIILMLLILIFGSIWWCKSPHTEESRKQVAEKIIPGIHVTSLTISDISNEGIRMNTRILFDNPLLVNINTSRIRYEVMIDSVLVLENVYDEPLSIQSGDTSVVELPVVLQKDALVSVLKYFKDFKIDSAEYSVHATLEVKVPIAGEKELKLNFSQRLPALKIPEMELTGLDLNLLRLRKKGIDVVLSVYNPNLFDIHLLESQFHFYIDDYFALRGSAKPEILLPAGKSAEIMLNANFLESKLTKTAWEILTGKNAPFSVHFSGVLRSENAVLDKSKIKMIVNGQMDELRELVNK